jgi:anaerobic ribonucleoside-triphosphate reductase activating protein
MYGHGMIIPSLVDGPGERAVVHFAGCSIGCPGCFNPETHDGQGWARTVQSVASEMLAISPRVTISGGEPTQQPFLLRLLLRELRAQGVPAAEVEGRAAALLQEGAVKKALLQQAERKGRQRGLIVAMQRLINAPLRRAA